MWGSPSFCHGACVLGGETDSEPVHKSTHACIQRVKTGLGKALVPIPLCVCVCVCACVLGGRFHYTSKSATPAEYPTVHCNSNTICLKASDPMGSGLGPQTALTPAHPNPDFRCQWQVQIVACASERPGSRLEASMTPSLGSVTLLEQPTGRNLSVTTVSNSLK